MGNRMDKWSLRLTQAVHFIGIFIVDRRGISLETYPGSQP